jgi:hypothetical protein
MGLEMLPDELLLVLKEQWPCRESQLRQLDAVLSVSLPARDSKNCSGLTSTATASSTKPAYPGRIRHPSHGKEQHHQIIPGSERSTARDCAMQRVHYG